MGYVFRKIVKDEFDKLHGLFPDNEQMWLKYRDMRLREFANHEIDVYAVLQNDTFIGELSVHYVSRDLTSEAIPKQRVYFHTFRLDEKYQGSGLGQRLIQFALSDLEQQGYTEFTIGVEDDNKRAKHIYRKFGFTEAIDRGHGDEFDPSDYTLYMRSIQKSNLKNKTGKRRDSAVQEEKTQKAMTNSPKSV